MGEITEALRRAREERERRLAAEPSRPERRGGEAAAAPAPWGPEPLPEPEPEPEPGPPPGPPAPREAAAREPDVRIPHGKHDGWVGHAVVADDGGTVAESFRHFALGVRKELELRGTRAVLVTSAVRQDGKTTTSCNLALALASVSAGRRIALVELDLRRPAVCQALGVPRPAIGLERVLRGEASLRDVCIATDAGLDLYVVSRPTAQAHEVLARPELGAALADLTRRYEVVVCDAPPVLVVPDVSLILAELDACVTVARAGATPRSAFRAMLQTLPEEKLVGAFLNNARTPRHYQRYDYQYGPESEAEPGET